MYTRFIFILALIGLVARADVADQPINVPVKFAAKASVLVDTSPIQANLSYYAQTSRLPDGIGTYTTQCALQASLNGTSSAINGPALYKTTEGIIYLTSGVTNVSLVDGQEYECLVNTTDVHSYKPPSFVSVGPQYGTYGVIFSAPPSGFKLSIDAIDKTSFETIKYTGFTSNADSRSKPRPYSYYQSKSFKVKLEQVDYSQSSVSLVFQAWTKGLYGPQNGSLPHPQECYNSVTLGGSNSDIRVSPSGGLGDYRGFPAVAASQSVNLKLNTSYSMTVSAGSGSATGSHGVYFKIPQGYKLFINGTESTTLDYASMTGSFTIKLSPATSGKPVRYLQGSVTASLNSASISASSMSDSLVTDVATSFLELGKRYTLQITGSNCTAGETIITPPPGYRMLVDGVLKNRITYSTASKTCTVVVLPPQDSFSGPAGSCSSILGGQVKWSMALGSMKNGQSAGCLSMISSAVSDWNQLYTPASLFYDPVSSSELQVYRADGITLSQILVNEAFVDIVAVSSTSYEIRVYAVSQASTGAFPKTATGNPFILYRVSKDTGSATKLNIIKETRADSNSITPSRVESTSIERAGSGVQTYLWTVKDWYLQGGTVNRTETRQWSANTSGGHDELVQTLDAKSKIVTQAARSHTRYEWGDTPTTTTVGATNGTTTTLDYNTSKASPSSYGFVNSKALGGGYWESYNYFPTTEYSKLGTVQQVYRPYANSPSSPDIERTAGLQTNYTYESDAFGMLRRLKTVDTQQNGRLLSKATVAYQTSTFNGMTVVTATRTDWTSQNGAGIVTAQSYYQEDVSDVFYRSQPHEQTSADGSKQCYVWQRGEFAGGVFTVGGNNTASRYGVITGASSASSGGTLAQSYAGYTIAPIYLITNRSTMSLTIRDSLARVARTESYVWDGATWQLLTWENREYNWANKLKNRTSNNGNVWEADYKGELMSWEKDEAGIRTDYQYDDSGRVRYAIKKGRDGRADITTEYTYDALGNILQKKTYVGESATEALVANWSFDTAGRLSSEQQPSMGATQITYNPNTRQKIITDPAKNTRIETYCLDGKISSVTGTGVVPEYYTYATLSGGGASMEVHLSYPTSPRWTKTTYDMLGRVTSSERPGPPNVANLVDNYFYNSITGLLIKKTIPGRAPTIYGYDALGQLETTTLDVNRNDVVNLSGPDRVSKHTTSYISLENAWWMQSVDTSWLKEGSSDSTTMQTVSSRLTGFSGQIRSETRSMDVEGNTTTEQISVDRDAATVTTTTALPGMAANAVVVTKNGLTASRTDVDGLSVTYGYDDLERPSRVTNPRTGDVITSYYPDTALPYQITDAANYATSMGYDALGRTVWTKNADNKTTRVDYTPLGAIWRRWGEATHPASFEYDEYGARYKIYQYQAEANWTGVKWPDNATPSGAIRWDHDPASGVLTSEVDSAGRSTNYDYTGAAQLWHIYAARAWTSSMGVNTTNFGNAVIFNTTAPTLTLNVPMPRITTTHSYDADTGELSGLDYNDNTPDIVYVRNRFGQPKSVTDATGTRLIAYDPTQPWRLNYTDLPAFYQTRRLTYKYETTTDSAAGTVKGRGRGFGLGLPSQVDSILSQTYVYTNQGRLDTLQSTGLQGSQNFTYGYLPNSRLIEKVTATGTGFESTRGYEPKRNLLTTVANTWNSSAVSRYTYQYDNLMRRKFVEQDGSAFADYGETTHRTFGYNNRGEMTEAGDHIGGNADSTRPLAGRTFACDFDAAGNRLWKQRTADQSTRQTYTPNALNQIEQVVTPPWFHVSGTASTDTRVVVGDTTPTRLGRYWEALLPVANGTSPKTLIYAVAGARPGAGTGGADLLYRAQKTAKIAPASSSPLYDEDGNLTQDARWTYEWDAENRLVGMETRASWNTATLTLPVRLEFVYDYLGRRVAKRVRSRALDGTNWMTDRETRFVYFGWDLLAETDATGTVLKSYVWGQGLAGGLEDGRQGGLLQITDTTTSKRYFPGYDGNGNIGSLTDRTDGTTAAAYEYTPWGETERLGGVYAASNSLRFSGNYADAETGLVYYGHRYYDAAMARFLNRDPIGVAGGENLYGIAGGDTVNRWDRLGLADNYNPSYTVYLPRVEINSTYLPSNPTRGNLPTTQVPSININIANILANRNRPVTASTSSSGLHNVVTGASSISTNSVTALTAPDTPKQSFTYADSVEDAGFDFSSGFLGLVDPLAYQAPNSGLSAYFDPDRGRGYEVIRANEGKKVGEMSIGSVGDAQRVLYALGKSYGSADVFRAKLAIYAQNDPAGYARNALRLQWVSAVSALIQGASTPGFRAGVGGGLALEGNALSDASRFRVSDFVRTDTMSRREFARLVQSIEADGIQNPFIKYTVIGNTPYVLHGSNRLLAARTLRIENQLIFQEVQLPFLGYKNAASVIESAVEVFGGGR